MKFIVYFISVILCIILIFFVTRYGLERRQGSPEKVSNEQSAEPPSGNEDSYISAAFAPKTQATLQDGESVTAVSMGISSLNYDEYLQRDGPDATLARAKELEGSKRESVVLALLNYLSRTDPEFVARELAKSGLSDTRKGFIVATLMRNWDSLEQALDWASTKLAGSHRAEAVAIGVGRLADISPERALEFFREMPKGGASLQILNRIVVAWAKNDHQQALNYVMESLEGQEKARGLNALAPIWVQRDIQSAKIYVAQNPDENSNRMLAHFIVIDGMKIDAAATFDWAIGLSGSAAERAIRSAVISWADADVSSAASYIEKCTAETQARIAPIFAAAWADIDPAKAAHWVSRWTDEKIQVEMVAKVLPRWSEISEVDCQNWINSLPELGKKKGVEFFDTKSKSGGVSVPNAAELSILIEDMSLFPQSLYDNHGVAGHR